MSATGSFGFWLAAHTGLQAIVPKHMLSMNELLIQDKKTLKIFSDNYCKLDIEIINRM